MHKEATNLDRIRVVCVASVLALACTSTDLRTEPFSVEGTIKDATTGESIRAARVTAWSCAQTCTAVARATADEAGRYTIHPVGANPFVIGADADGYIAGYWSSSSASTLETATRLTVDRSRLDIDIQLRHR